MAAQPRPHSDADWLIAVREEVKLRKASMKEQRKRIQTLSVPIRAKPGDAELLQRGSCRQQSYAEERRSLLDSFGTQLLRLRECSDTRPARPASAAELCSGGTEEIGRSIHADYGPPAASVCSEQSAGLRSSGKQASRASSARRCHRGSSRSMRKSESACSLGSRPATACGAGRAAAAAARATRQSQGETRRCCNHRLRPCAACEARQEREDARQAWRSRKQPLFLRRMQRQDGSTGGEPPVVEEGATSPPADTWSSGKLSLAFNAWPEAQLAEAADTGEQAKSCLLEVLEAGREASQRGAFANGSWLGDEAQDDEDVEPPVEAMQSTLKPEEVESAAADEPPCDDAMPTSVVKDESAPSHKAAHDDAESEDARAESLLSVAARFQEEMWAEAAADPTPEAEAEAEEGATEQLLLLQSAPSAGGGEDTAATLVAVAAVLHHDMEGSVAETVEEIPARDEDSSQPAAAADAEAAVEIAEKQTEELPTTGHSPRLAGEDHTSAAPMAAVDVASGSEIHAQETVELAAPDAAAVEPAAAESEEAGNESSADAAAATTDALAVVDVVPTTCHVSVVMPENDTEAAPVLGGCSRSANAETYTGIEAGGDEKESLYADRKSDIHAVADVATGSDVQLGQPDDSAIVDDAALHEDTATHQKGSLDGQSAADAEGATDALDAEPANLPEAGYTDLSKGSDQDADDQHLVHADMQSDTKPEVDVTTGCDVEDYGVGDLGAAADAREREDAQVEADIADPAAAAAAADEDEAEATDGGKPTDLAQPEEGGAPVAVEETAQAATELPEAGTKPEEPAQAQVAVSDAQEDRDDEEMPEVSAVNAYRLWIAEDLQAKGAELEAPEAAAAEEAASDSCREAADKRCQKEASEAAATYSEAQRSCSEAAAAEACEARSNGTGYSSGFAEESRSSQPDSSCHASGNDAAEPLGPSSAESSGAQHPAPAQSESQPHADLAQASAGSAQSLADNVAGESAAAESLGSRVAQPEDLQGGTGESLTEAAQQPADAANEVEAANGGGAEAAADDDMPHTGTAVDKAFAATPVESVCDGCADADVASTVRKSSKASSSSQPPEAGSSKSASSAVVEGGCEQTSRKPQEQQWSYAEDVQSSIGSAQPEAREASGSRLPSRASEASMGRHDGSHSSHWDYGEAVQTPAPSQVEPTAEQWRQESKSAAASWTYAEDAASRASEPRPPAANYDAATSHDVLEDGPVPPPAQDPSSLQPLKPSSNEAENNDALQVAEPSSGPRSETGESHAVSEVSAASEPLEPVVARSTSSGQASGHESLRSDVEEQPDKEFPDERDAVSCDAREAYPSEGEVVAEQECDALGQDTDAEAVSDPSADDHGMLPALELPSINIVRPPEERGPADTDAASVAKDDDDLLALAGMMFPDSSHADSEPPSSSADDDRQASKTAGSSEPLADSLCADSEMLALLEECAQGRQEDAKEAGEDSLLLSATDGALGGMDPSPSSQRAAHGPQIVVEGLESPRSLGSSGRGL
eukprot:TRINITY_DN30960_c0_g2_i4.p1 TRINITY_DN30960_c0_g2~~TRINITY_DN30960_c0_g2_i4.p1  ORF type:complete len:1507 (+),score=430.14 TRINITY_DN30960_c0_g2_i4:268-4788(+)